MPRRYRKRRYKKRRSTSYYRNKSYRAGRTGPRLITTRLTNLGTHYFKRTVSGTALSATNPVYGTGVQKTFSLSDLGDVTDFSNLFDTFMLTKIVMKIYPRFNSNQSNGTINPCLRIATDPDGGGDITATDMAQKKHKDLWLDRPKTFVMNDLSVLREVYRSVSATSYAPKKYIWIDMATPQVPYYSMTMDWLTEGPTAGWTATVEYDFYFKCKGVR